MLLLSPYTRILLWDSQHVKKAKTHFSSGIIVTLNPVTPVIYALSIKYVKHWWLGWNNRNASFSQQLQFSFKFCKTIHKKA